MEVHLTPTHYVITSQCPRRSTSRHTPKPQSPNPTTKVESLQQQQTNCATPETITHSSNRTDSTPPDLRILHYNDVYHVEPGSREPVGGIARFQTLCNLYASSSEKYAGQPELVTLFSGDAFNPSLESSVTKGMSYCENTVGLC
jgi:hypothetical protein